MFPHWAHCGEAGGVVGVNVGDDVPTGVDDKVREEDALLVDVSDNVMLLLGVCVDVVLVGVSVAAALAPCE